MTQHRTTPEANRLLLEGQMALAEIEHNGVRVNKEHLDRKTEEMKAEIKRLEDEMRADKDVYPIWRRTFPGGVKLGSRDQLAKVFFDVIGHKAKDYTKGGGGKKGRAKADKASFEDIDVPFVKLHQKCEAIKKTLATNLNGIRREMVETTDGWVVHPEFQLNTVSTFRSSSKNPNWQNSPVRDPEIAGLVRPCYIARAGNHFVEVDYAMAEVRGAACYTGDPNLIRYVKDKKSDMHRDMAGQIFMLPPTAEWITKDARRVMKGGFVFSSFYGQAYFMCAKNIWEAMVREKLTAGKGGIPIREHLRKKGITELDVVLVKNREGKWVLDHDPRPGSFGHHMKKVEQDFWGTRFKAYAQWKRDYYEEYRRTGGLTMFSGFAVNGLHSRNDVTNYPIQGFCFHWTLYALVHLCRLIRKYRMKTLVIGEIHDSIQFDVPPNELNNLLDLCQDVMVGMVEKKYKEHLNVPIEIECEVAPIGKSWFDKKEYVRGSDGKWALKT